MYNLYEIKNILKTFYNISGFRVSLHDIEQNEICSYPENLTDFCKEVQKNIKIKNNCIRNDLNAFKKVNETGEVFVYKCQCGLIEAVSPIYHYGILHGYLMIGQVCEDEADTFENLYKLNHKKFENDRLAEVIIKNVKSVSKESVSDYIKIMTIIAEHITNSNRLYSVDNNLAALVREHINLNYNKKISLDKLCYKFGCSKSTLSNYFKKEYGTTIFEYLMKTRIKKSRELLEQSNKTVKEISNLCGFSDQNYFSKQFFIHCGQSPTDYRNLITSKHN